MAIDKKKTADIEHITITAKVLAEITTENLDENATKVNMQRPKSVII